MFAPDPEPARILCAVCPVRRQCLDYALDNDIDLGVWGGLTFDERVRICPICHRPKEPSHLGCNGSHSLARLARLVEQERAGDTSVSVSHRAMPSAPTSVGCPVPRGRSHSTAKAYQLGCRCEASRLDLYRQRAARPDHGPFVERTDEERFEALIRVTDEGHWDWTGGRNGGNYGNFWLNGRTVRAHLFAWEKWIGPLEEGETLRPTCDFDGVCVNPHHFERGPRRVLWER